MTDLADIVGAPPPLATGDIYYLPFPKPLVDFVDALIAVAKKNESRDRVQHDRDWMTLAYIIRGWEILYPQEKASLDHLIAQLRLTEKSHGINREGEAMIQHQAEIPEHLHALIQAIFPHQKMDTQFIRAFVKHFPQFRPSKESL